MEYVTEPAKQVPVARDVDVVVAGSGISGLFASLAAARHGARVVLVDRMGMPGGNIGPGRIVGYGIGGSILSTQHERRYTGVVAEFIERLNKDLDDVPCTYSTMSHGVSRVAANMFEEEGVELVLSAYAADPIMDGDRACGLFVESKSGRIAIKAKVVIDATGDADTAARAGAPVRRRVTVEEISQDNVSAHPDHQHWNDGQIYFFIGEVDIKQYREFREKETALTSEQQQWADENLLIRWKGWPDSIIPALKEGWDSGEFRSEYDLRPNLRVALNDWFGFSTARPGIAGGRAGIFGDYDTGNWKDVSLMESAVRNIAYDGINYFRRKRIPGFENAYIISMAPFFGARGGPFIDSEFVLTPRDANAGLRVPDTLYIAYLDAPPDGQRRGHDMPYRMLLPKKIDGLLVTGRGAGFLRRGHDPATRERTNMMALGQATGIAAALAAAKGLTPRKLDVKELQSTLIRAGYYLGDDERLAELGIGL